MTGPGLGARDGLGLVGLGHRGARPGLRSRAPSEAGAERAERGPWVSGPGNGARRGKVSFKNVEF